MSQPWAGAVEFYITPWGFLKGAAENNATVSRRRADGKNYTVLTWSPKVTAASGKNYVVNGFLNDRNLVERVETWLADNIMGDMQILATYSGWLLHGVRGGLIAFQIIDRLRSGARARGVERVELSWILEDNWPMRRVIESLGAVPYKTYRLFRKALA